MTSEKQIRNFIESHPERAQSPMFVLSQMGLNPDRLGEVGELVEEILGDDKCGTSVPKIAGGVIPGSMKAKKQWLVWKSTPDGRKIPRAPYLTGGEDFVNAHDPDIWTSHTKAAKWAGRLPGYGLAFDIPDEGAEHVLIDFDYARDDKTGEIPNCVMEFVDRAGSYADVSTSGTGVHVMGRGRLPEDVGSIEDEFCEECGVDIEVYDNRRFVAMTGRKLTDAPDGCADLTELLDELADEYATTSGAAPDEMASAPEKTRDELEHVETTDDMQDVFDAVQHVKPSDIRLRSTVTEERSGGQSLDPSWSDSESGTRLWQDSDGWLYRKGNYALDAVQVVALEERIITDESDYPTGEDWHEAVEELRNRGAHIPKYTGSYTPTRDSLGLDEEAENEEEKIEQFLTEMEFSQRV